MSDLFGNHIVGFPTRRLNYKDLFQLYKLKISPEKFNSEAVLTSTHNLCFEPKISKIGIYPCISQFYDIHCTHMS